MTPTLRLYAAIGEVERQVALGHNVGLAVEVAAVGHRVDRGELAEALLVKLIERDRARAALAADGAE